VSDRNGGSGDQAFEAEQREEGTYEHQDTRLRAALMLLASLWRLIRGEDQRGRKLRWLLTLLRPYRKQVAAMIVGARRWRHRPWPGWRRPRSPPRTPRSTGST